MKASMQSHFTSDGDGLDRQQGHDVAAQHSQSSASASAHCCHCQGRASLNRGCAVKKITCMSCHHAVQELPTEGKSISGEPRKRELQQIAIQAGAYSPGVCMNHSRYTALISQANARLHPLMHAPGADACTAHLRLSRPLRRQGPLPDERTEAPPSAPSQAPAQPTRPAPSACTAAPRS